MESKLIFWLGKTIIKTPPFTDTDRRTAGGLLRELQQGSTIGPPDSKPMSIIGKRCHELVIRCWRVFYRIDDDAIIVAHIFRKQSQQTPRREITTAQQRLKQYDLDASDEN